MPQDEVFLNASVSRRFSYSSVCHVMCCIAVQLCYVVVALVKYGGAVIRRLSLRFVRTRIAGCSASDHGLPNTISGRRNSASYSGFPDNQKHV